MATLEVAVAKADAEAAAIREQLALREPVVKACAFVCDLNFQALCTRVQPSVVGR